MAISKAKFISLLNQIKTAKIGFLPALALIIAAMLAIPLLTSFVSVVWSADKTEKYRRQTQDFLKSDLHSKGGEYMGKIQGDVSSLRIVCTYLGRGTKRKDWNGNWSGYQNDLNCSRIMFGSRKTDFPLDFADFIKLISVIRKESKVMKVSIDFVQGVPVPVAEKIENGATTTTTTVVNGAATDTKKNGRISNKSYSTRKPAESTALKLKIMGGRGRASSSPEDFHFLFRAMAAIQTKPKTNKNITSNFPAPTIHPLPNQAPLPHRRRNGNKRLRFGK